MPRISRVVAVGHPHHVTQRGNYRQTVFETDQDYLLGNRRLGTLVQKEIIAVVFWTSLPISRELGASGVFLKLSGATTLSPPL